jgi:hypothetical protein
MYLAGPILCIQILESIKIHLLKETVQHKYNHRSTMKLSRFVKIQYVSFLYFQITNVALIYFPADILVVC